MKFMRITIISILFAAYISIGAQDIKVTVGEVKDSRTTGEYFAELEINLKFFGDILEKAKSIRCIVDKAVDDTGRDLIKEENWSADFERMDQDSPDRKDLNIRLKNPSRKASTVELSGTIDVYSPKSDPNSVITVKNFTGSAGSIISKGLKEAGIDLVVLTAEQYKIAQEQQKEKFDTSNVMGKMVEALSGLFGGFMEPGENSVILQMQDPDAKVIEIEFTDQSGKILNPTGTTTMQDVKVYDFEELLPGNAQLKIYLNTSLAMKKVSFFVKDIMLP